MTCTFSDGMKMTLPLYVITLPASVRLRVRMSCFLSGSHRTDIVCETVPTTYRALKTPFTSSTTNLPASTSVSSVRLDTRTDFIHVPMQSSCGISVSSQMFDCQSALIARRRDPIQPRRSPVRRITSNSLQATSPSEPSGGFSGPLAAGALTLLNSTACSENAFRIPVSINSSGVLPTSRSILLMTACGSAAQWYSFTTEPSASSCDGNCLGCAACGAKANVSASVCGASEENARSSSLTSH